MWFPNYSWKTRLVTNNTLLSITYQKLTNNVTVRMEGPLEYGSKTHMLCSALALSAYRIPPTILYLRVHSN